MRSALSFFFFSPANTILVPKQKRPVREDRGLHRQHGPLTWDVFLGVGEIDVQGVLAPGHALVLVGLGVGEPGSLASLSTPDTVEVGSLLVFTASLYSVALGTRLGEDLLASVSTHLTLKMMSGENLCLASVLPLLTVLCPRINCQMTQGQTGPGY